MDNERDVAPQQMKQTVIDIYGFTLIKNTIFNFKNWQQSDCAIA